MRILLVETEAVASTPLTQTLEANRYTLDRANTTQSVLDLATVVEYDLLLLDAQTPNLNSIHLCQRLRSQGFDAPILLLTASSSDADMVAGFDAGADD
ncbi:response regulator, partial [Pseudanabaenaceae cyanobacterium LEGE 13415]|nr:response regulator [Pseudanabaenaceae cyanobacterium LEGE 13415]